MTLTDIFLAQIVDPFRIGLIVVLVLTAGRTAGTMGLAVPLLLGVAFVAILIPMTLAVGDDTLRQVAVGLVTNGVILGIVLAAKAAFAKMSGGPR